MNRFFIDSGEITSGMLTITGEDFNHIKNVLRMKNGEDFEAVDERGLVHTCRIVSEEDRSILSEVLFTEESVVELPNEIVLFQGLPKSDKMELIIQKAVELGVHRIVPVTTRRTVVRLTDKKADGKTLRWQAISAAAAKQSKRICIPEVASPISFSEALKEAEKLDVLLLPYEGATDAPKTKRILEGIEKGRSIGIFIGPEGGFEKKETEEAEAAGAGIITLGKRILRTETAAIAMMSILMFELEARE